MITALHQGKWKMLHVHVGFIVNTQQLDYKSLLLPLK